MSCECLSTCKSDFIAKKSRYMNLIVLLNNLTISSDLTNIYTFIFDDINRLQNLIKRMEEMSNLSSCETAIPATNYYSNSVYIGIQTELAKIKQDNITEYETLSNLFGITVSDPDTNAETQGE